MPTYKITQDGTSYKVTAPSQEEALAALGIMNERENTLEEDIQGAGQRILDGLFFGYGDEISAAGRAGLGALFFVRAGLLNSAVLRLAKATAL